MMLEIGLFDIMQVDPTDHAADHGAVYRRRLDDLALADRLGLAAAFTAERHFMPHYRCPAPVAWVGAASQRTVNIRLGVLAFTLPIHAPVQLAEEIAVLDHLSGGRLEVGVGLGHRVEELVALGVDPSARIALFQERLAIMEGLWTGAEVTIQSDHDVVNEVVISPIPLQRPHPPLWYAGVDSGAAGWAGQRGMNLAVGFAPLETLVPPAAAFRHGVARRSADEDGKERPRGSSGRVALMRHVFLAETDDRARDEMVDDLYRLDSLNATESGDRPDRKAGAIARQAALVRDEVFVAGSPETVATQIDVARRELGIELFLANIYAAGIDDARIERALRLLAGPVTESVTAQTLEAGVSGHAVAPHD